ncbi:MAG: hypothetical protein E7C06_04360 [Eggerthella lenta]|nr:hypothetical protein [Eggerthella lenta]
MKTNAQHLADLMADPGDKRHGTRRGVELGCRCRLCCAERERLNAKRREDGRAKAAEARAKRELKASYPKPQARRKPRKPSKDVCTVDAILLPMMGKPSIDNEERACCVCGRPATNLHHIVRRGAGKLVVNGREVKKPKARLCGDGNASGCHGLAHANMLHFRWAETVCVDRSSGYVTTGGHFERILLDEPAKYQDALAMDGWEAL